MEKDYLKNLNIQVLCTGRTGSTYLDEILNNYPEANFGLTEKYNPNYITKHKFENCAKNNKILDSHYRFFKQSLLSIQEKYPNTKFIHLQRRNLVDHLTSEAIARGTKMWAANTVNKKRYTQMRMGLFHGFSSLSGLVVNIQQSRAFYSKIIEEQGVEVHEIWYEDILEKPQETLGSLFDYLSLDKKHIQHCLDGVKLLIQRDIKKKEYAIVRKVIKRYLDKK